MDMDNRGCLIWFFPFGAIFIDVIVATSSFKLLVQQVPEFIPEFPLIVFASTIIVLMELVFGADESPKWYTQIFIGIVPALSLVEGMLRISNHIIFKDPATDFLADGLLFVGLALMSFIVHKYLFDIAPVVVNSYRGK